MTPSGCVEPYDGVLALEHLHGQEPGVVLARLCDIGLTSAHVRTRVIPTVISYVIDHGKRGERFVT